MNRLTFKSSIEAIVMLLFLYSQAFGQNAVIKGYAFEDQNRGYLNMARIIVRDTITNTVFLDTYTNIEGYFYGNVPGGVPIVVEIGKDMFEPQSKKLTLQPNQTENLSFKMVRLPGYVFELTLAEKKINLDTPSKAINGAHFEMYNNTTRSIVVDIFNPSHEFKLNFIKGNHYTILIRKPGYLAKRLEAYVNVNGCILCFEGVGDVRPGVVDNLSGNNSIGVLLANVELEKAEVGKIISFANIQYELGSAELKKESYTELAKLATIALNNPSLSFEIGSHTDSRGSAESNLVLSKSRSASVVDYLVNKKNLSKNQLESTGYGEKKLVNRCADGIVCNEEEHQLNRRTELKILEIDTNFVEKSLMQIKTIEEFEFDLLNNNVKTYKVEEVPQEAKTVVNPINQEKASNPSVNGLNQTGKVLEHIEKSVPAVFADEVVNKQEAIEMPSQNDKIILSVDDINKKNKIKKYLIIAGKFSNLANAKKVVDKLYLLGYPDAKIVTEGSASVVIAGIFEKMIDAKDSSAHIMKNGIANKIEEQISESNP